MKHIVLTTIILALTTLACGSSTGGQFFANDGQVVDHLDIQLLAGGYHASDPVPPVRAEKVTCLPADYFPTVSGQIVSPYEKGITNLRVSAIAYGPGGEIIGSGFTYLDVLPANGQVAVEASITSAGPPASTELYAAISGLSEIE